MYVVTNKPESRQPPVTPTVYTLAMSSHTFPNLTAMTFINFSSVMVPTTIHLVYLYNVFLHPVLVAKHSSSVAVTCTSRRA